MRVGKELTHDFGGESMLLAGTDLALIFNNKSDASFKFLDCAEVHAAAIAQLAMQPNSKSLD